MQNIEEFEDTAHPDHEIDDRQFVTALARGLDVLRCFTVGDRVLSNGDIARRTQLPKSTVSRLTYTLTKLGYLQQLPDLAGYRVGPSVLALGYAATGSMRVRELARPLMQDLADYSNALVSLAARDRLDMIYLENCRSRSSVTLRLDTGMRMPIATTSIGRAFLAGLPQAERQFLLQHLERRAGQRWAEQQIGIRAAMEDYARRGFCLSIGEWKRDVNSVAVPLIIPELSDVVVFSCGGPSFSIKPRQLTEDLGPRLVYLVQHVAGLLAEP
ncbi:IclR family transcriptional regulator [Chitinivorax sp. B]|uniref:IclR family transcriptional regulator n=1 Tax=Chitinivorax sp. B TaxID=2502235 RepID=UPI0010F76919|nr:IclR family transcriptional regulator [Chitinivorax sp. B]